MTDKGLVDTAEQQQDHGAESSEGAPAVSVIIPAYQSAMYIGAAVESVLAQTFKRFELFVVNDGSPDTEELERVLEPYLDRILYLKQENRGPGGARNAAILKARGEYVAFLDSDDMWMPDFLAEQMMAVNKDPSLDLVYADALLFQNPTQAGRTFMEGNPSQGPVTFESLISEKCVVITSCVVARRQALIDAGLFDESFLRAEDYDLWLRLAHRGGRLGYQRKILARRRIHDASLGADTTSSVESQITVYEKIASQLSLSPQGLQLIESQIERGRAFLALEEGKRQMLAGQYAEASELIERADRYYKSYKLRITSLLLKIAPGLVRAIYTARRGVR